jgi:spermidine/putrescine-binding protein
MASRNTPALPALCLAAWFVAGCSHHDTASRSMSSAANQDDDKVVNLYTWANYTAPEVLESFEKLTGVKVRVSIFDTNETLEARHAT